MKRLIMWGLLGVLLGVIFCGESRTQEVLEATHPALKTGHVIYADSNYKEYPLRRDKTWFWEGTMDTIDGMLWDEVLLPNKHNKLLIKCQGFGPRLPDSDSAFLLLVIYTHIFTAEGRTDIFTIDTICKGARADNFDSTYWYVWEFPTQEIDSLIWVLEGSWHAVASVKLRWWELRT